MKKRKHRWLFILIFIVLLLMAGIGGWFLLQSKKNNKVNKSDTIVKKNVSVLTGDMDKDQLPTEVTSDTLVFAKKPKYKKGQVIVSGIIEGAESGFIRRVTDIERKGDTYIVHTESALLTDVFEQAHIVKKFRITDEGLQEVEITAEDQVADAATNGMVQTAFKTMKPCDATGKLIQTSSAAEVGDPDAVLGIYDQEITCEASGDGVEFSGGARARLELEFRLDINLKGEVVFGIALHNKNSIELSASVNEGASKGFEKEIWSKDLKNTEFKVGEPIGVPIVITNELFATVEAEAGIEGEIFTTCTISTDNRIGFLYDSKKGVEPINEWDHSGNGLSWETGFQVSGNCEAGIYLHLKSKLYDATGLECKAGIAGSAEGQAKVSTKDGLAGFAGSIDLAVTPKVSGTLVVEIPIVDDRLAEADLFDVDLPALWSKHWESSKDWKADLEWTKSGDKGNTYITRYREVMAVECPAFKIRYPSDWKVTTEEIGDGDSPIEEHVVIENSRGVTVSYWSCEYELGGDSRIMAKVEIEKVADAKFDPGYAAGTDEDYSESLGKFMVAKVHTIGEIWPDEGDYFTSEDGPTFYALLPENREGTEEIQVQAENVDDFSFDYPTPYAFIAETPDGSEFTKEEEEQVIQILQSVELAGY